MGAAYQSQAVAGYNASPPSDDGSQTSTNKITWNSTIKTKLADPLNTFIAAVNSQLVTWSDFSSVTTSTGLTTTTAHHMQTIEVTSGSPTISLGDAATMTKNYVVTVTNEGTGAPVIALATAGNTLDGTAAGTFTFPTGTKTSFTFKVNNAATGYDTEKIGGKSPYVYGSLITSTVDTGNTGSLSLKLNNGESVLQLDRAGTTANFINIFSHVTGNAPQIRFTGTDTDVSGAFYTKGAGSYTFNTNVAAAEVQFQILRTASATRNITITGSNGGNPTIATTAGSLAITPSVAIAGGSLQIGSTVGSANGVNIPYSIAYNVRNNANNADLAVISAITINSVADVCRVGQGSSNTVITARVVAGAPSTSDIPASTWALWRDTSGATTKLYFNNAGTLQSVALV